MKKRTTRPIDKEFALQILQAHVRNAVELDGEGRFRFDRYVADEKQREAMIASIVDHAGRLIASIFEDPAHYDLANKEDQS